MKSVFSELLGGSSVCEVTHRWSPALVTPSGTTVTSMTFGVLHIYWPPL